jgi:cephalosporin-C deacetylase-like acetyl esterase
LIFQVLFSDLFAQTETEIRKQYLQQILELQERPQSHDEFVSYHDKSWTDWLERTGTLPPDFSRVPSLPFLPDPLIIDEGGENIPVESMEQWGGQRSWIKEHVKQLLSGTFPDPPDTVNPVTLDERIENGIHIELIELRFDDDPRAILTIEVFTPPGDGPFPVFMTQWNHRGWAQIAVRRGYKGVIYAGADSRDDTRDYLSLYPDYDWSTLMTRAWGAHRVIDYLYTLDHVEKNKIAITGHSRNAKQSLFAAAFDGRINAVISSSGGTGGEMPYRYTDDRHSNESIDFLMSRRTHWFHPGMRFYIGREHKLPIDQNSLMALIAPNSLLLSSSIREGGGGDAWAVEHMYSSLQGIYKFLNASGRLGIRLRDGGHGVESRDIEAYVDWLDIQFGRNQSLVWQNTLYYDYSFEKWKELSGEDINPEDFENRNPGWHLEQMESSNPEVRLTEWENRRPSIINDIHWLLGDEPPGVSAEPIESLSNRQDYVNSFLNRPEVSNGRVQHIAPYNALGDYLYGDLYYPADEHGEMLTGGFNKLPVVIYLHHNSNTGYNNRPETGLNTMFEDLISRGFAILAMDLIGYGQRIEDGQFFYQRYPNWSKLGRMTSDTRAAIDALHSLEFIDNDQIYLAGYSLGGTVSLMTAALDHRVNGVAVSSAFTPLRNQSEEIEGTKAYSHLYGLLPRLGFFAGNENHLPVDFPEIISLIAPRPLYIIAPELDRHADFDRLLETRDKTGIIYDWYDSGENLQFETPYNFNTFSPDQRQRITNWFDRLANRSK